LTRLFANLFICQLIFLSFASCDDILDVDLPGNILPREDVFDSPEAIKAAVNGMYAENFAVHRIYEYILPLYLSIAADESYHNLPNNYNYEELRKNAYGPSNDYVGFLWSYPYASTLLSNGLIEGLSQTVVISEEEKRHYTGEAKYFRAYNYFVLVNLFGDVPWVKSANIRETALQPRESKEKIITEAEGIIDDLKFTETALANSSNSNAYVTKAAASALLARVYLYHEDWAEAEAKAGEVIGTSGYELETDLDNVFLRSSKETIFRSSSAAGQPSYVGRTYLAVVLLNASYFRLTSDLVNSFEDEDLRKAKWLKNETTYFHPYKYKRNAAASAGAAEDLVLLRLAEQYLIRAEARAQQNKLTGENGAIADINVIRNRAGLSALPETLPKEQVLLAIENERRHELFVEEGHRWWDLVRTGRADAVLGNKAKFPEKQWESYKALFPVPEGELTQNSNLTPNPGYGDIN
jgi:hypothetical protein